MDGKWLVQKLQQNGFTLQDLAGQSGIALPVLEKIANSDEGSAQDWDTILSVLNQYPAVRYPASDILDDIAADIETYGSDAPCNVFYGVSDNSLVFCEYQCLDGGGLHGANVDTTYLSMMQISLADLQVVMTRQNCTIE